ncbi:hypothetical protein CERZMDRAFT_90787 [Cercospora zeae-maydis SCOH1-5]|uniref:Uncharacterized protein n=1 Tax=Cercospora zeae-maydis SCOH1-5 TaxID=717836 RepID=A0A6A6FEM2_9PEZI|nr:hypothetical protein CERZMDRAFT_90787 [Cercospora zeae-maydis SCOH1-5]
MPHDWSTELLEALRNFSLQTSGRPEFATQVLRRAVQQQVARQGGSPALNKTDVAVAMHMAREGEVAPDMAPPFPELNTRTSQMSLRDRPEDVTTPKKPSAVVNPDQARAGNSEKAIAGATSSPPPQEADFEMILDSEPDIGLAEGSQRGQRDDQEWAAIPDQEPPTGPRSLQAGKRQREMQMKLAMLEYEEARARKKLVQADLDQILARRKLLHLGVDPDDL